MVYFKKIEKNRRGDLNSSLFGIILSVVSILILIGILSNSFLKETENKVIEKDNAESIVSFVDYSLSNKQFLDVGNCYMLLKLINLENFQFEEENKNYFLIIDKEGVYIIDLKYFEILEKGFDYKKNYRKFFEFKNKDFKIMIDKTGVDDIDLKLKEEVDFLILNPKLEDNQNKYEFFYIKKVKSRSTASSIFRLEEIDGKFLVFNKLLKVLFVAGNENSEIIVKKNLCSFNFLKKEEISKQITSSKDGYNLDFVNNRLFFEFKNDAGEIAKTSFEWDGGPICYIEKKQVDCKNVFTNYDDKMSYNDFLVEMENVILFETDNELMSGALIVSFEPLSLDEIKRNNLNFDLIYENVFLPLNYDEDIISLPSYKKKENFYEIDGFFGGNKNINGCSYEVCNDLVILENKVYFVLEYGVKSDKIEKVKFFAFREEFLKKKLNMETGEYDLFFNGRKILSFDDKEKFKKITADKYGSLGGNVEVFWLKDVLLDGKKEYDVFLTQKQIDSILEVME